MIEGVNMHNSLKAAFLAATAATLITVGIPGAFWDAPYRSPTASEITTALNVNANDVDVRQATQGRTYAAPAGSIDPEWSRYVVGLEDVSLKSTTIFFKEPLSRSVMEKQLQQNGWSLSSELDQRIYTKNGLRARVDGSVNDESMMVSRVSPAWLAPTSALLGVLLGLVTFGLIRRKLTSVSPTPATVLGACLVAPTLVWQLCTAIYEAVAVDEALRGLHYYAYPLEAFVVSAVWKIGAVILVAEALRTWQKTKTNGSTPRLATQ